MKLFSPQKTRDSLVIKESMARTALNQLARALAIKTKEYNEFREKVDGEIKGEEEIIKTALLELRNEKEDLELAVSSLENRRKDALKPLDNRRKQIQEWEKDVQDREDKLEHEEFSFTRKSGEFDRELEATIKLKKALRLKRNALNRQLKVVEKDCYRQQEAAEEAEKNSREIEEKLVIVEEKEEQISTREKSLEEDKKAFSSMLLKKKSSLKKEYDKIQDERAKLKNAMELAKKKYGIRN